jgi:hypothetical protein
MTQRYRDSNGCEAMESIFKPCATMKDTKFKYAGYNNFACPDGRFYSTTIFIEA